MSQKPPDNKTAADTVCESLSVEDTSVEYSPRAPRRGREGIGRKTVEAAIATLRARLGRDPTLRELRAEPGTGSMSTLSRHRREILNEQLLITGSAGDTKTDPALFKAMALAHESINTGSVPPLHAMSVAEPGWPQTDTDARVRHAGNMQRLAQDKSAEFERELITAKATITALKDRVQSAEKMATEQSERTEAAHRHVHELISQSTSLQYKLDSAESDNASLREALDAAHRKIDRFERRA